MEPHVAVDAFRQALNTSIKGGLFSLDDSRILILALDTLNRLHPKPEELESEPQASPKIEKVAEPTLEQ